MANKFWGGVVNALLPGTPFNRHTGQYGKTALRNSLISGVAGQLNPIAGTLVQAGFNQTAPQQQWNAGLEAGDHFAGVRDSVRNSLQPSMSVPNVGFSGFGNSQLQTGGAGGSSQPSMAGWNDRWEEAMGGIQGQIDNAYANHTQGNALRGMSNNDYFNQADSFAGMGVGIGGAERTSSYALSDAARQIAKNKGWM